MFLPIRFTAIRSKNVFAMFLPKLDSATDIRFHRACPGFALISFIYPKAGNRVGVLLLLTSGPIIAHYLQNCCWKIWLQSRNRSSVNLQNSAFF